MPKQESLTFFAVSSGDHEFPCWAVTKETFVQLTGTEPDVEKDVDYFHEGMFRLYEWQTPMPFFPPEKNKVLEITTWTEEDGSICQRIRPISTL